VESQIGFDMKVFESDKKECQQDADGKKQQTNKFLLRQNGITPGV